MYKVSQIAEITGGKISGKKEDLVVDRFITDTRKTGSSLTAIFIALTGPNFNGHQFIPNAYDQGIRVFLVSEKVQVPLPDAVYIEVQNTLRAFQKLAAHHLKKLKLPVIAVTGSNGKTIVKEWLYQIIHTYLNVIRSPKSYNSQVGVPLSVMQAGKQHEYGIFEAGVSQKGEMKNLAAVLKPRFGIFTNIGDAHASGFENIQEKIEEKLRLFEKSEVLIYSKDQSLLDKSIQAWSKKHDTVLLTWSMKAQADLAVYQIEESQKGKKISAIFHGKIVTLELPFKDTSSIENAMHCWLMALHLGISNEKIKRMASQLSPIDMRLYQTEGIGDTQLIHDYYNSDLTSLEMAIDFLSRQQVKPRKTVIISDLEQNDLPPAKLYRKVARLLLDKKIDRVIGIGKNIYQMKFVFKVPEQSFFEDMASFRKAFSSLNWHRESILIKGARSFRFEQIGRLLQNKQHESRFEINLSLMEHNFDYFRSRLRAKTKIMAMVKAYSYGSGTHEVARLLQYKHVDYLAVAYADEGIHLRKSGINTPIMVLNATPENFQVMEEYRLEPVIYSFGMLEALIKAIRSAAVNELKIHLEFDTGMHRLGFGLKDHKTLTNLIEGETGISVISVFTHLASSESNAGAEFTSEQTRRFEEICKKLKKSLGYSFIRHASNTGGILNHPEAEFDMVRLGIGLYGINPSGASENHDLKAVARLLSYISQIRSVPAGEGIGYGSLSPADYDREIAVVAIGYADGVDRRLSCGKGYFTINGHKAPIVGNVCMDMTMIDVTEISCREGDEVVIIGENPSLQKIAQITRTIPYEVLTGISERVKRVFIQE